MSTEGGLKRPGGAGQAGPGDPGPKGVGGGLGDCNLKSNELLQVVLATILTIDLYH